MLAFFYKLTKTPNLKFFFLGGGGGGGGGGKAGGSKHNVQMFQMSLLLFFKEYKCAKLF